MRTAKEIAQEIIEGKGLYREKRLEKRKKREDVEKDENETK